jgi:ankyrin repeat protein
MINHYWQYLEHNPANITNSDQDFEVVVARYKEKDLSWIAKEFPNEKVTIYNKGNETLTLDQTPNSYKIVNIPNFGWFGGTILHHIVNNYDHLANRTLFLQAAPYAVELFLPLARYKDDLPSKCKNIFAKCITTTLSHENKEFTRQSRIENFSTTKYRNFEQIDYNMIDFAHRFIDPDYQPDSPLNMVWGAEFAVDSAKIYNHEKEYYEKMLAKFQRPFPMEDFFLEKLWDEVFEPSKAPKQLNKFLFEASFAGNTEAVKQLIDAGAEVNFLDEKYGMNSLHAAVTERHTNTVALLLSEGASVNITTNTEKTPLYIAVLYDHLEMVKLLIQHEAEVSSDQYMNPLALAARLEHYEIHKILLDKYWVDLKQANTNIPVCTSIPNDNKFEVVIVRYNEDISWVADEFPCDKVTIYNAGNDTLESSPYYTEIKIPNIGYYEGKILLHIINNYHNLPDRILFLQANPYDSYVFLPLARHKGKLNSTCNNIIAKCNPNHNLKAESIGMQKFDWETGINGKYKNFNYKDNNMLAFANKFLGPIEENFSICYASLFAVDKDIILSHRLEYYQSLASSINYAQYPIEAFYFERLWDAILTPPSKIAYKLDPLLFEAVKTGDKQKVSSLITIGGNVNAINAQRDSLLNVAAHYDNSEIIDLLLKEGAIGKNIALAIAAYFGSHNAAESLLNAGAELISDNLAAPLTISALHKNKTRANQNTYKLMINNYWKWLEHNPVNITAIQNSFEAVIVHYKEDLSWVVKEFTNTNVTIYNKGPDNIIDAPSNWKIVAIDNLGWFGGTILYHIVNNYGHLADRTLFVQGDPYDQEIFLPLEEYRNDLPSKCKNIIAKCTETTLLEQFYKLSNQTANPWNNHPKYGCFEPVDYNIIDFAQQFVDPNYSAEEPLTMVWGAQFAVEADKIYNHEKEYYEKILANFQTQCPMDDFFIEKLWDEIFSARESIEII